MLTITISGLPARNSHQCHNIGYCNNVCTHHSYSLFRSLLWPSSDFLSINWHHLALKMMSQFVDFQLTLAIISQLLWSLYLVSVLMKLRQRTIWGLWIEPGCFSSANHMPVLQRLSCGWLKQNKNIYKRSHSEKCVLISGKNSFHLVFMNYTFKTLPRGREECFKNQMLKWNGYKNMWSSILLYFFFWISNALIKIKEQVAFRRSGHRNSLTLGHITE